MKKTGVSRLRTRLSIVLMVLAAAAILLGAMRSGWTPTLVGAGLLIAAAAVKPWKCPSCGKRSPIKPRWSEPGETYCPYCRSRLAYDDEETQE